METKLTNALNDVLRTSGYIFEIINNNKKQSNIVAGPNNQLIPPPVTNQLSLSISHFDQILDDTVRKFNDARWCIEQIVDSKQRQEELKVQEEAERQKREVAERKRQEEELRRREDRTKEEERLAQERSKREERERHERQAKERGDQEKTKSVPGEDNMDGLVDQGFDFDMESAKELDIPNPSDILSSISYKGGPKEEGKEETDAKTEKLDMDMDNVIGNGESLLDDLNMDLLGQDFDTGVGGDEEFDVDTFLNQFGSGE